MNEDLLKGKWNQFKGKIKTQWSKLTDDDLKQAEGNREIIIGKIQEKYGKDKEEAQKEFDEWINNQ
ncbi:MAG: CsbD family protein [Bacillota bacterium]